MHRNVTQNRTVLVLGGYGYVGRYTVKALQNAGVNVLIGTRGLDGHPARPSERYVCLHRTLTRHLWTEVLSGVDAVINTVGILRERRGESFEAVHHLAVGALAQACRAHNIPLVHVSALGIDGQVQNSNTLSKLHGETAIRTSGCTGAIVRASVVDEVDGYGSGWMRRVADWPVWLLPAGATHLMSPVNATDMGEALATIALRQLNSKAPDNSMAVVEIGCGENFSLRDYLIRLRRSDQHSLAAPLLTIRVPQTLARLFAHVFDIFHLTPYSVAHHELLESDNVPSHNLLPQLLGRAPTPIGVRKIAFCEDESAASGAKPSHMGSGAN